VGRPLPPAPGRRRLHDAGQGARRPVDRRPGPRDRDRRRRLRGGPRRQSRLRQPLRRHHHPPDHPDPLDPHRGRPRIWQRFADVGLTTVQACGDSARNVLCCPVSGVDADEVSTPCPVALAISEFFTGNREYANLPRKFKISVTGCLEDCAQAEINDIGLWPARRRRRHARLQRPGRRRSVRRGADGVGHRRLHRARPGRRAHPGHRPALRRARQPREPRLARMRYLVQELGAEGSGPSLAARTRFELGPPARASPALPGRPRRRPPPAPGGSGLRGLLVSRWAGCRGSSWSRPARLAETYGDGTVRLGTDQNFVLTGVAEDRSTICWTRSCSRSTRRSRVRSSGAWWPAPGASSAGSPWSRPRSAPSSGPAGSTPSWRDDRATRGRGRERGRGRRHHPDALLGVLRPRAPSRRSPTSASGATRPRGDQLVEAVDIGLGGSLGPTPPSSTGSRARPVDEVPEALLRVVTPLPVRAPRPDEASTTGPGGPQRRACGHPGRGDRVRGRSGE
jgi:ferredoxin-nitrite reductase